MALAPRELDLTHALIMFLWPDIFYFCPDAKYAGNFNTMPFTLIRNWFSCFFGFRLVLFYWPHDMIVLLALAPTILDLR